MEVEITLKFRIDEKALNKKLDGWDIKTNKELMDSVATLIDKHIEGSELIQCHIGDRFRCR